LPAQSESQNPNCFVCSSNFVTVKIDTNRCSLNHFVQRVLKEKLCMNEPSIMVNNDIIYECGGGLEEFEIDHMNKQLQKLLKQVKIEHNTSVSVDDNTQEFKLQISIIHCEEFFDEDQTFEIVQLQQKSEPIVTKKRPSSVLPQESIKRTKEEEDDVMIVDQPTKRKREDSQNVSSKKQKSNNHGDIIEL